MFGVSNSNTQTLSPQQMHCFVYVHEGAVLRHILRDPKLIQDHAVIAAAPQLIAKLIQK